MSILTIIESIRKEGHLSRENFDKLVEIDGYYSKMICDLCSRANDYDTLYYYLDSQKIYGQVLKKVLEKINQRESLKPQTATPQAIKEKIKHIAY